MATVRIIYDVDGWAFHARAVALQKCAPPDLQIETAALPHRDQVDAAIGEREPDLVFVLSQLELPMVCRALATRAWRSKVVSSWNSGWPLQIPQFYTTYRDTDAVVINNATAWERIGRLPRTYMIANGVDRDVFRVVTPLEVRRPRVLWTGSELKRRRKGYDHLLLPLQDRLQQNGIECELLLVDSYGDDKRTPSQMAEWYNTGTVLVCASAVEGTPNPALEAAACGCTVVSTPVGNMPELIRDGENGYLVERHLDALLAGVRAASADYLRLATAMQEDIRAWDWRDRSHDFYRLFRAVLAPAAAIEVRKPDLSERVTVFVTTVGAPSYPACRAHLEVQDCAFRLEVIDRVAPMHAAFQRMLDQCRTPFFVQVDEDMLLYPYAIRTLCERIVSAGERTTMMMGDLYDAHLERCIVGVKAYRHAVVRRYPFADVQSFEKLQVRQMVNDGYEVVWPPAAKQPTAGWTLGLHGTHWTPESIYERYWTLAIRRAQYPRQLDWFEEYPSIFLERFQEDPTALNFFALMGVVSAALGTQRDVRDKDFRTYGALPGLAAARQLFGQMGGDRKVPATAQRVAAPIEAERLAQGTGR